MRLVPPLGLLDPLVEEFVGQFDAAGQDNEAVTTRYDVSGVPMQGGYVAKLCPVRAQNDALLLTEPVPPPPALERRFRRGLEFEADVLAEIAHLHRQAVLIEGEDTAGREAATARALNGDAALILGGRLPSDPIGRRVGKPDVLVRAEEGGWRAVDVKHHMTLDAAEDAPARISELTLPALEAAHDDETFTARKRRDDLLQLAHYQRMLEAAGFAASDGRYGGIIGVERRIVWYDLDAPMWRTPSASGATKVRTTMEVYDFEFDFRLDIIAVAEMHAADASVDLLVVPVKIAECDGCPWFDYCMPILESGSGDVSLVPRIGWREWKVHREHDVNDRVALAGLDVPTARLVSAAIDVAGLAGAIESLPSDTKIADVDGLSAPQIKKLESAGIETVGEVPKLHAATAAYAGAGLQMLPEQIDQARAALGPSPAYRRRGVEQITVPRGDVEVDVDMENIEDGVYLWGTFVTDRSDTRLATPGYRSFVTWEPLPGDAETNNFLQFWTWLDRLREEVEDEGLVFRAYCYSAGAENRFLRSVGLAAGVLDDVEAFIPSDCWVDLLRVFNAQVMTGHASGLKVVAPLAGFSWSVEDPGGGDSMVHYDTAVGSDDEAGREASRQWLLTYNREDVEATLALRNWLERDGDAIPSIESLEGTR